jgi:hypothetical protein
MRKKINVMIATPTRDGKVCTGYLQGVTSMIASGHNFNTKYLLNFTLAISKGVSDIVNGRDEIANDFYKNKNYDLLLWIDSDTGFSSIEVISSIIKAYEENEVAFTLPQPRKSLNGSSPKDFWTLDPEKVTTMKKPGQTSKLYTSGCGFGLFGVFRSGFDQIAEKVAKNPRVITRIRYFSGMEGKDAEGLSYHQRMLMRTSEEEAPIFISEDKSFCFRLCEATGKKIRLFPFSVTHESESINFSTPWPFANENEKKEMLLNFYGEENID